MLSIFEHFRVNRIERPDAAAFLIAAGDRSVPISWREFTRDIEEIAWLAENKLAPGTTVGLLGENSYEWICAHAAGLFAGVVVVPLEVGLSPREIADRLVFVGAKVLIHSALYADKAHEVERLVPGLVVGGFGSRKAEELMSIARAALDMGDDGVFDLPPRDGSQTAMIVFTSGTTSRPRGAELTLDSLGSFAEFASARLPLKCGDRSLMLLPLHHIYGIAVTYLMLAKGVSLGVCPDFRRIIDAVERFRANCLYLVPALAEILASKISQRGRSAEEVFGCPIDWVLSGGAPLSRRTHEHLESLGMRVLQIYGLTETCAAYAMSPYADPRPGSVGLGARGDGGLEIKTSQEGHLLIRGPAVMKGYFQERVSSAQVLSSDGWFDTGDIGRIDADGYVWITGRASRTIVLSSGKKVAPEELEELILAIPGVEEVVVSGDGATRELRAEIFASVSEPTLRRQIDALNRRQPVHKRIRHVVARAEPFPRTASGKIKVAPPEVEVVSSPETLLPPVSMESALRSRPASRVRHLLLKITFWIFSVTAVMVLFLNFFQAYVVRTGAALPEWTKFWLGFFEEAGELLLAILVLPVLFFLHRFIQRLRER